MAYEYLSFEINKSSKKTELGQYIKSFSENLETVL